MKNSITILVILFQVVVQPITAKSIYNTGTNQIPGKIWFSTVAEILSTPAFDTTLASNRFTSLNNIFARLYLEQPLQDVYERLGYEYDFEKEKNDYNYALRIYVNGDIKIQWLDELNPHDFKLVTTRAYLLRGSMDELENKAGNLSISWDKMISKLNAGTYSIEVEMVPLNTMNVDEDLPVLAKGGFTLMVNNLSNPDEREELKADLPEATLKSPELEKLILQASTELYENAIPVRVIITDVKGDWTYAEDENGLTTGRKIIASVVYHFSGRDICFLKTGLFHQVHKGNGIYEDTRFVKEVPGYFEYEIDCRISDKK
ncbi:MAG: hypothetical protein JW731_10145 [Bacteroidales bacterium]|nr:hypothetical protein [Bacteroidales bacterium]